MKLLAAAIAVAVPIVVLRATDASHGPSSVASSDVASAVASDGATASCAVEVGPVALPGAIRESSGIARSADGALWTHNDGAEARLYRVTEAGAIAQTVQLEGAGAVDIEDIDAGPCPGASGECLWLADTGDNDSDRADVALLAVPMPGPGASSASAVRLPFRYPAGARDAEALAVLPAGAAVVVSKGRDTPIEAYHLALADAAGARAARPLVQLAAEPSENRDRVTGAGASEDGAWIALRTNDALTIHRADALLGGRAEPALAFDLGPLGEAQGEGVDIAADGTVWLTSEGERGTPTLARLRCALPE